MKKFSFCFFANVTIVPCLSIWQCFVLATTRRSRFYWLECSWFLRSQLARSALSCASGYRVDDSISALLRCGGLFVGNLCTYYYYFMVYGSKCNNKIAAASC